MSKGKRYDNERKLNMKKVFAVIIAIAVLIMFVIIVGKLLKATPTSGTTKQAEQSFYTVYTNSKWGVIDGTGKIIIEPTFEEMIIIPDNTKPVFLCQYNVNEQEGSYQTKVLNEKKEEIIKDYDLVEPIEQIDEWNNVSYLKNTLRVKKQGKYGLVDSNGKTLLAYEYDSIVPLKGVENSLVTEKEGKKGLVDNAGSIIIPNEYKEIKPLTNQYENGYIVITEENKVGVIGYDKKVALDAIYEDIRAVCENSSYVIKQEGTWKLVDKEQSFLEGKFDDITSINGENVVFVKSGNYGVITKSGEEKIPAEYQSLQYAFSDYYIAQKDGKYGIINLQKEVCLEFAYTNITYHKIGDFIEVSKEDYTSDLLDRDLQVKVSGILSEVNQEKGYLKIRVADQYEYYNFKFEKKEAKDVLTTNTLFLSKKDGKYGYVNKEGIVVVNYIYDDATEQNKFGFVGVKQNGKWGCLSSKGEVVIEPTYTLDNNLQIDFIGKWHLSVDINANFYTDN